MLAVLMSEVCASDSGVPALWVSAAPLEHEAPASVRQVCGQLPTPLSKSFSQKSESRPFPSLGAQGFWVWCGSPTCSILHALRHRHLLCVGVFQCESAPSLFSVPLRPLLRPCPVDSHVLGTASSSRSPSGDRFPARFQDWVGSGSDIGILLKDQ